MSITPFLRGCGETYGFPFPAVVSILEPGSVSETVKNLLEAVKLYSSIILLATDVLFACLMISIIIRKERYIKWMPSFLNALAISLCATWGMLVLYQVNLSKEDLLGPLNDVYGTCYSYCFWKVPMNIYMMIPDKIHDTILKKTGMSSRDISMDVLARTWFIIVTVFLAGLLNAAEGLKNKFSKTPFVIK